MPDKLKLIIATRIEELKVKAKERYEIVVEPIIKYEVVGANAGFATFATQELDFHLGLALENRELFIEQVVGHEFCHLVADKVYQHRGHGVEWKEVMKTFDLRPDRTYKLDMTNFTRAPRTYPYSCTCTDHQFGKPTHHHFQKNGQLFECKLCGGLLQFKGHERDVRRYQAGTHENDIMKTLAEYEKLAVPRLHQILLLRDRFGISYSTAKSYYYEYRPK